MEFRGENLNPSSCKTNDCLIRAIMRSQNKTSEQDWREILNELTNIGIEKYKIFNDPEVYQKYFETNGYTMIFNRKRDKVFLNHQEFLFTHLKGNFVIISKCHSYAYINGIIYDAGNENEFKKWLQKAKYISVVFEKQ